MRIARRVWTATAACVLTLTPALGDAITLLSSVRVEGGKAITLRQVATLEGAHAEELGDIEVLPSVGDDAGVEIGIDQLRDSIKAARPDARLGVLAFSGDRCVVRAMRATIETPAAAPAATPSSKPAIEWRHASDVRESTVRGAVAARLVSFLRVKPEDVRLSFSPGDERLLSLSADGRTLDIQPAGLGAQVPVLVRVFEGDKIAAAGTVRVRVEQRWAIAASRAALKRGDIVREEHLLREDRWVTPGERYADADSVIGMVVRNRVEAGQVFVEDDVEPAVLIRRGDIVTVACLSGSIVVNIKARALAPGREGEMIELAPTTNAKARVRAKVIGPGQAVVNADVPGDNVFGAEAEQREAAPEPIAAARPTQSAIVGTIQVQRVTERPDGSIIVEAKTPGGKRPTKKMKFLPLDE
ncbi:MAG TPA: flagellar basal body P-ring formation chaperone FlgA [Phycisphaerales bacterium]